ncbi:MAG: hypothetical protein IBX61_09320 [Thermoleophilia bacterium]|nr:hypothetical protein [Thermoleophilia bacterium]
MKKIIVLIFLVLAISGCGSEPAIDEDQPETKTDKEAPAATIELAQPSAPALTGKIEVQFLGVDSSWQPSADYYERRIVNENHTPVAVEVELYNGTDELAYIDAEIEIDGGRYTAGWSYLGHPQDIGAETELKPGAKATGVLTFPLMKDDPKPWVLVITHDVYGDYSEIVELGRWELP